TVDAGAVDLRPRSLSGPWTGRVMAVRGVARNFSSTRRTGAPATPRTRIHCRRAWSGREPGELAAILAGPLITVGGLIVLAGIGLHAWMAGRRDRLRVATGRAGVLGGRFVLRQQAREGRLARSARSPRASGAAGSVLALTLVLGLAAVALTGV